MSILHSPGAGVGPDERHRGSASQTVQALVKPASGRYRGRCSGPRRRGVHAGTAAVKFRYLSTVMRRLRYISTTPLAMRLSRSGRGCCNSSRLSSDLTTLTSSGVSQIGQ